MRKLRIDITSLAQRRFGELVGNNQSNDSEHGLALVLAGLVRQLLGNSYGSSTIIVSSNAMKEVAERGAWLEIASDGDDMIIRTTLK